MKLSPLAPKSVMMLWAGITFLLVILLWRSRRRAAPSRLRLKSRETRPQAPGKASTAQQGAFGSESLNDEGYINLNVIFYHEEQCFDAYEVLALPAGSSLERVQAAYEALHKQFPEKSELLTAAFTAIQQNTRAKSS